ncbi:uncharacterized protein LOC119724142 [Patiria miniata]|uniref:Uncharacterized protein n=1 Tax=Patiria miniata TaxID=46514 RepID=A0A913ZIW9_PATMI|nr:uncharacterized protein LOC119724142 [Patiria miniata]
MATERSNNNTAASGSWLRNVVCPPSGCCCLCSFLPCRRQDTRPTDTSWFQVEDGQLQSNAEQKHKKRRRRKKKKRPRDFSANAGERYDTNTSINRLTAVTSNTSESDASHMRTEKPLEHATRVSDLLKHLLREAENISSQSSAAPSSDETTPPLLRSDDHDRYQPQVLMEITSSTQTEGELERSVRYTAGKSEMKV